MLQIYKQSNDSRSFTILLKVKASAKQDLIEEFVDSDGKKFLKIQVKAAPCDGKANDAIRPLSKLNF